MPPYMCGVCSLAVACGRQVCSGCGRYRDLIHRRKCRDCHRLDANGGRTNHQRKHTRSEEHASLTLLLPPDIKRARTDNADREPVVPAAGALLTFHTGSVACAYAASVWRFFDSYSRVACACSLLWPRTDAK